MKTKTNSKKGSRNTWFPFIILIKMFMISALILAGMQSTLQAQEVQYTNPTWRFGVAGGANFNFYRGSTHQLSTIFTPPVVFNHGYGVGLFIAPLIEFQRPDSRFGFMLQAGYDSRKGAFDQKNLACRDCPVDLSTNLSYITVEPSLRFAPFRSNFYLFGGPRFAFNLDKAFIFQQGINPAFPNEIAPPNVEGDFSNIEETIISMQIGAGLDIPLSSQNNRTQFIMSPFVSFHPYFGQNPRTIETWNITTLRAGIVLKLGQGRRVNEQKEEKEEVVQLVYEEPKVEFTVDAPSNVPTKRRVRETFPVLNYVFFNIGSTEIPNRYILLKKDDVKSFSADQLETASPLTQSGRSARQMNVYYNVINILGDRMVQFPLTTINLIGSSEIGPEDGKKMAESVKVYLVNIFGINPTRISTKGEFVPETVGNPIYHELLSEENRKVSIESSSPELLMEFQSGPNSPLKPIEIVAIQEAPVDSYVTFNVKGANEAFTSWSLKITDSKGVSQNFGPYIQEIIRIPGKSILGTRLEETFKVDMTGQTKRGAIIVRETTTKMVLWTPSEIEEGLRFSIIFEFDKSKATAIYEKYLQEVVTPKIPQNGKVIIHGHTDVIGDFSSNQELSMERVNEVKNIIENELSKSRRSDVKFEIRGFGENENVAPFDNELPEERAYNRTVIIDIIPVTN